MKHTYKRILNEYYLKVIDWLNNVQIPNYIEKKQARYVQVIAISSAIMSLMCIPLSILLENPTTRFIFASILVVCAVNLFLSVWVIRRNNFQAGIYVMVLGTLALAFGTGIFFGFRRPVFAMLSFMCPITTAGLLLDKRQFNVIILLSAAIIGGILTFETITPQWVGFAATDTSVAITIFMNWITLGVASVLFGQFGGTLRQSLNESLQREKELQALRESLEETVAERTRSLEHALQEAEQAREVAEVANQRKSTFLATMSHELRTPLSTILGYSELMVTEQENPLTPTMLRGARQIFRDGTHLLDLINDVLDIAKIESGSYEIYQHSCDLSALCRDVESTLHPQFIEKGLQFIVHLDNTPLIVWADKKRLRQILLNLLSNALKFTPNGVVCLNVKIVNEQALVTVRDTGIGIASNKLTSIFETFQQVDQDFSREYEGTGLGLSITKHLVELHGGELWVESAEGKGTTFFFTLPLYKEDIMIGSQTKIESTA
jgi:signal transduction histidine kinase